MNTQNCDEQFLWFITSSNKLSFNDEVIPMTIIHILFLLRSNKLFLVCWAAKKTNHMSIKASYNRTEVGYIL